MNRISELRQRAGFDIGDVADIVGIDVIELALAERGIGLTHFDVVVAMAGLFEADPADLYPSVAAQFHSIQDPEDGDMRAQMMEPERSSALVLAGIDPDIASWYAIVKLKSGNERRYRVSSAERARIRSDLTDNDATDGYLLFYADCRNVAVRRSAISELHFTNTASYAQFSSHESSFDVVIVSPRSPRPETISVVPDGGDDGDGARPFFDFLEAAREGKATMKFLLMEDGDDERFIGIDMLELMEIPVGVTMPDLYTGDAEPALPDPAAGLEKMEVMGQA